MIKRIWLKVLSTIHKIADFIKIRVLLWAWVRINPKISNEVKNQYANVINYTNTRSDVDVVLCGVPFHKEEFMRIIEDMWSEKYASFA